MSTNEQARYTADEVLETERILRKHSNGPGTFDFEAADMLRAYAQSLNAPAGGVSDAMVRKAEGLRNDLHAAECNLPEGWADAAADWTRDAQELLEHLAALSATEPAAQVEARPVYPNNAKLALQFGYAHGFIAATKWPAPVSQDVDSPAFRQECDAFVESNAHLYTAPPAQPAERVPEGFALTLVRDGLIRVSETNGTKQSPGQSTLIDRDRYPVEYGFLSAMLTASPAPSESESEGGKGVDAVSRYVPAKTCQCLTIGQRKYCLDRHVCSMPETQCSTGAAR